MGNRSYLNGYLRPEKYQLRRMMFNFLKRLKKIHITGACHCCGKCCRNLILIDKGKPIDNIEQFNKLKKKDSNYERFNPTYRDEEDKLLYFSCDLLNEENKCEDHQNRLAICRKYPNPKMFKYGGSLLEGCGYKIKAGKDFKEIFDQEIKKKNKKR